MRVLMVLLALLAVPYVAAVAQGKAKGHDAEHCARRLEKYALKNKNKKEKITKCADLPPPPPPPPAACSNSAPGTAGSTIISGFVYRDQDPFDDLASWCIKLTGAATATAVTDAYGYYEFTGLPGGTYTICEEPQAGWNESFPTGSFGTACPTGFGWTFTLGDGTEASYVNFGNVPQ